MQITVSPISYKKSYVPKPVHFGNAQRGVQTLTHIKLGSCMGGYIGKIQVRKADNSEAFLNVYKKYIENGYEEYSVKNLAEEVLGEIKLVVNKFTDYNELNYPQDPSHVLVSELRNYSNPATPYYINGLEYHKDIGTRLMQIALKRSEEALCNGNIRLISKNESKNWYKKVIGMVEEFPPSISQGGRVFNVHNPNSMILPASARERLSGLQGGL